MPSDDNEVPVEPIEPDWVDQPVELRFRGSRRSLMVVIGLLSVGTSTVPTLRRPESDGSTEQLMGEVGSNVVDELNEEFFGGIVGREISKGRVRETLDPSERFVIREEDVEDLIEVEVVEGGDE